jgi:hypothetical protein
MKKEGVTANSLDVVVPEKGADKTAKRNNLLMRNKYFVDRVGAGFSSIQFLNILFSFTGASFLFIGIANALRSAINTIASSVAKEVVDKRAISKRVIVVTGIIFGFSFLFIALSISLLSRWLFAVSMIVGGIGFVIHGDIFQIYIDRYMGKWKSQMFGGWMTTLGILTTVVALIISALIMDSVPLSGKLIVLPVLGMVLFFGFLISSEVSAFSFILSAYLLMKMKLVFEERQGRLNVLDYLYDLKIKMGDYFKNKYLLVLTLATIFSAAFQALINCYVGIYVYQKYGEVFLGGFLNVGVMFGLALLAALLGPILTSKLSKNLGVAPMFVFGTLLMAILPLTLAYNNFLPAIIAANALSVLGAAFIGSSHGIVASRLLNKEDRNTFYMSSGLFAIIPFLVIVISLASLAQHAGLAVLFKYVGFGIIACLFPLYFLMVLWLSKKSI